MVHARKIAFFALVVIFGLFAFSNLSIAQIRKSTRPVGSKSKISKDSPQTKMVDAIVDNIVSQLWELTDEHFHKGEYSHIVNLSKIVYTARPNIVDAYSNAGWLLWSMSRESEAVAIYEQGIKQNPDSYYMFDEIGAYYLRHGKDYQKALEYLIKGAACKDVTWNCLNNLAHAYERNNNLVKAEEVWVRAAKIPADLAAKSNLVRVRRLIQKQSVVK